ncbi:MAG: polar amino acid transport system ATP-binding protein [Marinobacter psychrophilus]|jgi:polar amino acid transport system ATP-binding protein|uniref:amino acid ABC transporter ATP-binding protein n=1 Tax=Marinobacter psychrophilus TaxID=330734 RepID=UPI0039E29A99
MTPPENAEQTSTTTSASRVLQLQGISKSFADNEVLKDISLNVDRGQVLCLIGPSGCGKSTLLRCINWLETPDSGRVILNGQRFGVHKSGAKMRDGDLARMRSRVAMVFQHFALWPHLSVIDNIMASPLHVQHRDRQEVREEAIALLEKVGLTDKAEMFPSSLSGGQKQRVGIARALAMKPELLLFDEPTSALDPMLVGEVLGVIRDLADEGATMVIVTHEMEFARQVASQVIFMSDGHIAEAGPPEEFFAAPKSDKAKQFLARFHQHLEARSAPAVER